MLLIGAVSAIFGGVLKTEGNWTVFESKEAQFNVLFPKPPEIQSQKVLTTVGPTDSQDFRVTLQKGHLTYSVGHIEYPAGTMIDHKQATEGVVTALVGQFKGVMELQSQNSVVGKSYPAMEIIFKGSDAGARVWMVLNGVHHYQISVSGKQSYVDDPQTNEFLNSFQLRSNQ